MTAEKREIRITLWGYGGEFVMGQVSDETWQWWTEQHEDLVQEWATGELDQSVVPEPYQFIESGCWYECDSLLHHSGVEMSSHSGITVVDVATGNQLLESRSLDPDDLMDFEIQTECTDEYYASLQPQGTKWFFGQSTEKGTFFDEQITVTGVFDPAKLALKYMDIEGVLSFSGMSYDGEDIEDSVCCDTVGKALNVALLDSAD